MEDDEESARDGASTPISKAPCGELIPRHSRACNVVAFAPMQPNIIATGLEKVRNDYCTLFMCGYRSLKLHRSFDLGHGIGGCIVSARGRVSVERKNQYLCQH